MDLLFGLPDFFILIGVAIIILGFALKIDTIFTVVLAGIVTGIIAKMGVNDILTTLGQAFVTNRYMTIFVLSLPVIGMLEKNGLKQVAVDKISKIKAASQGRILSLYLFIRTLAAAGGLRLQGHVLFIRPLILPISEGAAKNKYKNLKEEDIERIRGLSGAVENFGNFFGQNAFIASSGILLIVGTFDEQGVDVSTAAVSGWSWIIVLLIVVLGTAYFLLHDKLLDRKYSKREDK